MLNGFREKLWQVNVVGDKARPNYRVPLVRCGQCDGCVPLLRSTFVSSLGGAYCQECRDTFKDDPPRVSRERKRVQA